MKGIPVKRHNIYFFGCDLSYNHIMLNIPVRHEKFESLLSQQTTSLQQPYANPCLRQQSFTGGKSNSLRAASGTGCLNKHSPSSKPKWYIRQRLILRLAGRTLQIANSAV
jgi:hypothetical protein